MEKTFNLMLFFQPGSCRGADVLSYPPYSSIYCGHMIEPGSSQKVSWRAHHVVCLGLFNLVEAIPLQVRPKPMSSNKVVCLGCKHVAIVGTLPPWPVTCIEEVLCSVVPCPHHPIMWVYPASWNGLPGHGNLAPSCERFSRWLNTNDAHPSEGAACLTKVLPLSRSPRPTYIYFILDVS